MSIVLTWRDVSCGNRTLPRQIRKQPRVGDVVGGKTGLELVTRVYRHGKRLDVLDRLDRAWTIDRAPSGYWTVYPTLAPPGGVLRPIGADEQCFCIDEDCPGCGWPERVTPEVRLRQRGACTVNTPYQKAMLHDVYRGTDADGNTLYIGLFEAATPDGAKTWAVWVRAGRIIAAHQYTASKRVTALRQWREIAKMPNVDTLPKTDPLGVHGTTWKQWAPLARQTTAREAVTR